MWRIFNKKNRNYTIGGVIAFVIATFLVYRYVLPDRAKAWLRAFMIKPEMAVGIEGWEEESRKRAPIKVTGDTGRSPGTAIHI